MARDKSPGYIITCMYNDGIWDMITFVESRNYLNFFWYWIIACLANININYKCTRQYDAHCLQIQGLFFYRLLQAVYSCASLLVLDKTPLKLRLGRCIDIFYTYRCIELINIVISIFDMYFDMQKWELERDLNLRLCDWQSNANAIITHPQGLLVPG